MAVWSEALSLNTASVRIQARACEKVAGDLGLGGIFRQFPPLHTTGQSGIRLKMAHMWQ